MKRITCCFLGNRTKKLPWGKNENNESCVRIKELTKYLIEQAIKDGYKYFISSLAVGYDMICAELVLDLQKTYPHIKLIGVIAFKEQERYWTKEEKIRYNEILSKISTLITISREYNSECIDRRNKYIIDNSSLLIALYNGKRSGVKKAIDYSKDNNIKVEIIDI